MKTKESIQNLANTNVWNPCTQLKDFDAMPPLDIVAAEGEYLYLKSGERILDGIGSWWCKLLGHGHPRLIAALKEQADRFEHVMTGYATYDAIERLSLRLANLTHLQKVFYASDGACSVEVALKMAHQAKCMQGIQAPRIMTLENAYHGETCGALSVTDVAYFKKPYEGLLFEPSVLRGLPYVTGETDPLWHDCSSVWSKLEAQLNREKPDIIIAEPIIQSAAGMLVYSADCLRRISHWAKERGAYLIVDEIMTGFGRTGKWFAYQHAGIQPDFVCVGKGLTGGVTPMSAVITSDEVFSNFYDQFESGKTFFHSHTYSGNALAVAVANACLDELEENNWVQRAASLTKPLQATMDELASQHSFASNSRVLGAVAAFDVNFPEYPRFGYSLFKEALKRGLLLRPLGSTVYVTLPINTDFQAWKSLFSDVYNILLHF